MTTKSNRLVRLVTSWKLGLETAGKSPKTIRSYTDTALLFARWFETELQRLDDAGMPTPALSPRGIESAHVRRFLLAERERTSAATAAHHYRNLRVWFGWMVTEEIITERKNPMAKVEKPEVPKKVMPGLTDEELDALYKRVGGKSFEALRDRTIYNIFTDTGMRVSGLAGLRISEDPKRNDVLLDRKRLRIINKGGDQVLVPIGRVTARDIDRYLRKREDHPAAGTSERFLLGKRGPMTPSGIQQMLKRRGKQAGVVGLHPHRFRHNFAHEWLAGGGSETDLMLIGGWKTRDMIGRYAEHAAASRAWAAHAELSPTDRRHAS